MQVAVVHKFWDYDAKIRPARLLSIADYEGRFRVAIYHIITQRYIGGVVCFVTSMVPVLFLARPERLHQCIGVVQAGRELTPAAPPLPQRTTATAVARVHR